MTDKEKAEEYAIKITDELKNKGCISNEEINQRYAGIIQGYEYGYKAGQKHEADKIFDEWCSGNHGYPQKCGFIKNLEAQIPQWHDLRKNPNDLPKEIEICSNPVYVISPHGNSDLAQYDYKLKLWCYKYSNEHLLYEVIAWCELPKFEE